MAKQWFVRAEIHVNTGKTTWIRKVGGACIGGRGVDGEVGQGGCWLINGTLTACGLAAVIRRPASKADERAGRRRRTELQMPEAKRVKYYSHIWLAPVGPALSPMGTLASLPRPPVFGMVQPGASDFSRPSRRGKSEIDCM